MGGMRKGGSDFILLLLNDNSLILLILNTAVNNIFCTLSVGYNCEICAPGYFRPESKQTDEDVREKGRREVGQGLSCVTNILVLVNINKI